MLVWVGVFILCVSAWVGLNNNYSNMHGATVKKNVISNIGDCLPRPISNVMSDINWYNIHVVQACQMRSAQTANASRGNVFTWVERTYNLKKKTH